MPPTINLHPAGKTKIKHVEKGDTFLSDNTLYQCIEASRGENSCVAYAWKNGYVGHFGWNVDVQLVRVEVNVYPIV